ncbi:DUF488 domain-containing protein [Novosphingobium meiothermophilum]|uniref:DUF488 domain-containing protein n=1 Tax=Novosphingobium meiothermophilum TaxID=2202251 RepID=UPI00137526FB|nr:DUF488 domain-containing protein [Novosphingobium meiothermophilum]
MISVLSVGHSNIGWDEFSYALDQFNVGCIIDVRSSPWSRWQHFCKTELRGRLNRVGVSYVHLGDVLGGRPRSGPTDYATRRGTAAFTTGIKTVLEIAARCTPALLCAERDPLHCHRFLLISRHLNELPNVGVWHIRHDGTLEGHSQAEDRLLALHGMSGDLLASREEQVAEAYTRQERRLG